MSSKKQIEANRLNSRSSTGPKSQNGKTSVSKNARKHGLLSTETLLPWEDGKCLEDLNENLISSLQPVGELESILAHRITSITWRLRRTGRIEVGILAFSRFADDLSQTELNDEALDRIATRTKSGTVQGASSVPNNNIIELQLNSLLKTIETNDKLSTESPRLGKTFMDSAQSLSILLRYETSLEKSLYKALHELQRLQAARRGQVVPLPVVVDLHGDVGSETP